MSKRYPKLEYIYPAVGDVNNLLHESKLSGPKRTGDNGKNDELCDHDHPTGRPVKLRGTVDGRGLQISKKTP